jgi:hypothetical protein
VSDVADALNTVQDTALDLAVEQAVLRRNIADSFVNLGRRNQNLLGRQLDFITELETNETSPDALANLFRLDHLATRMRRNAESLLVLAGIEPPRQWAAPVRLTDVIRAALGEVEDYQRVTVRGVEPATIIGSAAADLAHLLAELIENALVFSPPDQTVDIRGRTRPGRAAAGAGDLSGYTLAVIDSGLGMPATDVAAANRRLAGAESFTIAPSKYLGHYVAGNLAARHDITVRLDNSPGNGITATVTVPPGLLTTDEVTSAPVTPPHGHRALPLHTFAPPPAPVALPPPQPPRALPAAMPGHVPDAPPHDPPPPPSPPRPVEPWRALPVAMAGHVPDARPLDRSTLPPQSVRPEAVPVAPAVPQAPPPLWPRSLPIAARERARSEQQTPGADRGPGAAARPLHGAVTASGLSRRIPGPRAGSARAATGDQAVVAALGRYAPPAPGPAVPPVPDPGAPAPFSHPAPAATPPAPVAPAMVPPAPAVPETSPLTPPDALTRRVKGAQLPETSVVSLRDDHTEPPHFRALARAVPSPVPSRATDVQRLLTSFTAGVQRGLEDARQQATHRTSGPVPVVGPTPPAAQDRR